MNTLKFLSTFLLTIVFLNSCSSDDEPEIPLGDYERGFFITNEGPFQTGSGTITFVSDDGIVSQNIYKTVNNEDLGNIVNSMSIGSEKAYIVVNNSNKIVVVNRFTMEKITTIEGSSISNPRYFVIQGNTGYVSNWGDPLNSLDDFITVIDLNTDTIIDVISVGEGPENMRIYNDNLYVTLEGGWNQNNKVVIIDTNSNSIDTTLSVGDVPNSIIADDDGNMWVLCGGNPNYTQNESAGRLYKINTNNFDVSYFEFELGEHPEHLAGEVNKLYYTLNNRVFAMNSDSSQLPNESVNGFDGSYYAMKINNGELYATDAGANFNSEGDLRIFDLNSGVLLETIKTGIIPGDIVFQN